MKDFDMAAAKRGAKVCTRVGDRARILLFDLKNGPYEIVAVVKTKSCSEYINTYNSAGRCYESGIDEDDLMMADDDYLEKLERGEYDRTDHFGESTEKVDWDYWRRMYAGMAMQGLLARFCPAPYCNCSNVDQYQFTAFESVKYADALIEKLKKTQK